MITLSSILNNLSEDKINKVVAGGWSWSYHYHSYSSHSSASSHSSHSSH